ncbi:rhomboid family intramembrane serine protease [Pediococcus pentosaceus]|uniref:rhomboid family intramembrane serine protease n=1 Tax=Pediococcus pentosaceus TaxID=1255 RepID=UPI00223B70C3|nr:rhomboid family intramembrane serine protease [Pediococcus pentosaceus]MCS8573304.1 rhomboid family intramembrane serine protease [Pediococcus pentosaceus]
MSDQKQPLKRLYEGPFVTQTIVGINILVFLWLTLIGGSTNISILVTHGALVPVLVQNGQGLWTIFTSMFIHIGFEHILFNMIALYFIGRLLERMIGHWKFVLIYIFSGLFANLASLALSNPNSISAGASGAIFGIIGVWLMMAEQYREYPALMDMGKQMLLFSVLGLISGLLGTNMNIIAHLGGLVSGFLIAYVIGFPKFGKVPTWKRIGSAILIVLMMIAFCKLAFTS